MGEPSRSCHGEGHVRTGSGGAGGSLGVGGAARAHGLVRNRRDPSAQPSSGKDRSYKPMAKSSGGQRESDGVVVAVTPCSERGGSEGPRLWSRRSRRYAPGHGRDSTRSNHPGGLCPPCRSRGRATVATGKRARTPTPAMGCGQAVPEGAVSTPCMTVSTGVTSCGRRGGGSAGTGARPGSTGDPGRRRGLRRRADARRAASRTSAQARTVPRPPGVWTSQSQTAAAAAGHPHGPRSGGPAGGQDRAGADLRGGLLAGLVRVSAEAVGDAGDGAHPDGVPAGVRVGRRGRHPGLLRHHRPRRVCGAGRAAGLGPAGAQAGRASGSGGGDGGRRGPARRSPGRRRAG